MTNIVIPMPNDSYARVEELRMGLNAKVSELVEKIAALEQRVELLEKQIKEMTPA